MRRRPLVGPGALAAALVVLVTGNAPPGTAATLDHRCQRAAVTPELRAAYTVSQSFTPPSTGIEAVAVRLGVIDQYVGPLTARLTVRPPGDLRDPTAGPNATYEAPGVTVSEATVQLDSRKWFPTRFRHSWVSLPLTARASPSVPLRTGTWSIDIDFPLDRDFRPYGAHIGWSVCDADYQGGAAFAGINPNMANRAAADSGAPNYPGTLPSQPSTGVRYTAVSDFEFRIFRSA